MSKFFVKTSEIKDKSINITGDNVNHIKNVLRLKQNDKIEICNSENQKSYICIIDEISKNNIKCSILKEKEETTESNIFLSIFQGIPKGEKMEWIIEKCTEIGASEFIPLKMERCVVKLDNEKSKENKLQRWQKIAESAAMQSGRNIIPTVKNIMEFQKLNDILTQYDLIIVAYENEKSNTLKNELKKLNCKENAIRIAVIIGPEGGISDNEIKYVRELKIPVITLGKRILRTETAPIAISSIIMYELET